MSGQVEGKAIVVTGAATGIGRTSALALSAEGARLILADMNQEELDHTADLVRKNNGEVFTTLCDVSVTADIVKLHEQAMKNLGAIDCAVNNAGIAGILGVPAAEYPEDIFDKVIAVNLKGVWVCMREQINQMMKQGHGSIVNMASAAGLIGLPNAAYTASKHGVVGLTKSAAITYADKGIRVNAICPGYVHTPATAPAIDSSEAVRDSLIGMHPIGRLGEQEEIAAAVVWLCSDASSFVVGHALPVDGGLVAK